MDNNKTNVKKGVVPFSEVGKQPVKVRHMSDQSIARCNINIKAEAQRGFDVNNQPRFSRARVLKK